jgi:hypothetical protein
VDAALGHLSAIINSMVLLPYRPENGFFVNFYDIQATK